MRRTGEKWLIATFLAPALLFYGVLVVYPVGRAMVISLYDWSGFSRIMRFAGIGNFAMLAKDEVFWGALKNNAFYLIVPGIITLTLAVFFASVLARGIKGARVFRVTYFFPNVISLVVISLLWSFIYNPTIGLVNTFLSAPIVPSLSAAGGHLAFHWIPLVAHCQTAWLDPNRMQPALVAPLVWSAVGFYMVLYIAAIQSIPEDIFDAARVDGSSGWQTFRNVIFPLVWETTKVAVVFLVIGGLKIFDLLWVLSYGSPINQNHTIATYMYRKAFVDGEMGYGTALSVVIFVLIFCATAVSLRLMKREAVEY